MNRKDAMAWGVSVCSGPLCWQSYKDKIQGKSPNALEEAMLLRIQAALQVPEARAIRVMTRLALAQHLTVRQRISRGMSSSPS